MFAGPWKDWMAKLQHSYEYASVITAFHVGEGRFGCGSRLCQARSSLGGGDQPVIMAISCVCGTAEIPSALVHYPSRLPSGSYHMKALICERGAQ